MEKTAEDKACSSSLCFLRPSLLCVTILVLSLVFACFSSFGFSPFLVAISVLILSTVFIATFTKKKVVLDGKPVQDEDAIYGQENMLEMDVGGKIQPLIETVTQENATQRSEIGHEENATQHATQRSEIGHEENATRRSEVGQVFDYLVGSTNLLSDIESGDESTTSEDCELNWISTGNLGQSPAISDGSVSDDDDSLIEIALPGQHSVNLEEGPKQKLLPNSPDFLPESILLQHGLMELLADEHEMNEEENLIEIDISMGMFKD